MNEALLQGALASAVPIWIEQVRGWSQSYRDERARACQDVITGQGDLILYRSPKKGETAAAFNRLAEGLAILAFYPGGVHFAGLHWQATDDHRRILFRGTHCLKCGAPPADTSEFWQAVTG